MLLAIVLVILCRMCLQQDHHHAPHLLALHHNLGVLQTLIGELEACMARS